MLDTTILREHDIRGIVGETRKTEDVCGIGRAFGTVVLRAGGRSVAVGYDGRLSSPALEAALIEGLEATGSPSIGSASVPVRCSTSPHITSMPMAA